MENLLIEKYIANNHFGRFMGMDFKIIEDGKVDYFLKIKTEHMATPHSAHGGVISALVDSALGVAGLSAVYKDAKVISTVEFKLNFLAPVYLHDELKAMARVDQAGKRILIISCDVINLTRNSCIVAKALGTFNAYPAEKAGY